MVGGRRRGSVGWPAWGLALALGCGGEPVGSKLPKPNPTDVAIGAAAAAAATSLIEAKEGKRKPEKNEDGTEKRAPTGPRETVPSGVLDRAEDPNADAETDAGPRAQCPEPTTDETSPALDFGGRPDCEPEP